MRQVDCRTHLRNPMPKSNPSTLLAELNHLLAERSALRPLFERYRFFLNTRKYSAERDEIEESVKNIICAGLPLSKQNLPQASALAQCAYVLRTALSRPELLDNPALVWDRPLVPGCLVTNWHESLKQRLYDLCGQLDSAFTRILSP